MKPTRTVFRTGMKVLMVAAGLVVIQALVPGRPSEAAEVTSMSSRLVAPPQFGLSQLIAYPNPARLSSTIRYRLNQAAETLECKIYDMEGKHVRTLNGTTGAGRGEVFWDLTDNRGNGASKGVYIARVTASGGGNRTRDALRIAVQR
jgi:hypothetical protein